ncbi:MAG TPA: M48 family metalloprotease [Candidatus Methylomirabilis sp.]|nr:M48 family metalloprotease [Candidatus Methylomirabilis sp.]
MTRRTVLALPSLLLAAGLVAGPVASCARNPVTGKNELSLVSEGQEIQMGQQAAQEVAQTIGFVDDPELQSYVADIGERMAGKSERPDLPWEFHVVNDASVNAFALPGGFIYVTRGLLGHMNSEAELATVLGHEIGHVTARHSVQQISKAQLATLGLGIGSIVSSDLAQFAGLASQGLQVLFLKYGRDAENQADELGFRYALGQNYDVREMARVFETLNRASQEGGEGGRLPEWLSTHPNPENRVKRTEERLDTLHTSLANATVGRDEYLRQIDGLAFGEDPRQGFFEGAMFYHPDMRFQLHFPEGWKAQNMPSAVVAISPKEDAIIQLGLAGDASPREAASQFLSQEGVKAGNGSTSSINGNSAATSYFQAQTQQGVIEGIVSFISYGGKTFGLLGYTPQGNLQAYDGEFRETIRSFDQLRNSAALSVKPAVVQLVRVPSQMTLAQFNQQYPSTISIEELGIINELAGPESVVPRGRTLKRVTGGRAPGQTQE